MADSTRLVYEPEKARPGLTPRISGNVHRRSIEHGGSDVPAEKPKFEIALDAVGICSKTVWVLLPQGRIGFDVEITVDLPPGSRGIHMSRMEEAVSGLYQRKFSDLRHYATVLSRSVLERQEGRRCSVTLGGNIPHLWRSCVSDRISVDSVKVLARAEASVAGQGSISVDSRIGLGINHMTACPCTQAYTRSVFGKENSQVPLPTHSQRSATTLEVQDSERLLGYDDILHCLSCSLHATQDLLKRPDEAEIVLKSHNDPQFAEDVVRTIAASFVQMFGHILPGSSEVRIESLSLESIHSHNVVCRLFSTVDDIRSRLSGTL